MWGKKGYQMKCSNCGAEIPSNSRQCNFCGSQISVQMMREQQELNKQGCPQCGSANIAFNREKQGELRGDNGTQVVRATIGYCKDCGFTWDTTPTYEEPKTRKTWLWVLGWIFIFPVPLTILMFNSERTESIDKKIRIGIVAIAWLLYFAIGFAGSANNMRTTKEPVTTPTNETEIVESEANANKNISTSVNTNFNTNSNVSTNTATSSDVEPFGSSDRKSDIDSGGNVDSRQQEQQEEQPQAQQEPQPQEEQTEAVVYVTNSGKKYHRQGCPTIRNSSLIELTEDDAKAQGYEPCKKCYG